MTAAPLTIAGPGLAEVEAARLIVSRVAEVTPMETSRYLSDVLGAPVHLKCENLQRTGSYKIRGAYNRMSRLSDEEKARGVVAASAGNHAQGVAFAARELGDGVVGDDAVADQRFEDGAVAAGADEQLQVFGGGVLVGGEGVDDAGGDVVERRRG